MIIKAKCNTHPKAVVLILEGTVTFQNEAKQPVAENSERATRIGLDEHNLYCTYDHTPFDPTPDPTPYDSVDHDIVFQVISVDGHWLANGN